MVLKMMMDGNIIEDDDSPHVEVTPLMCPLSAPPYQLFSSACRPLILQDNIIGNPIAFDFAFLSKLATLRMIVGQNI